MVIYIPTENPQIVGSVLAGTAVDNHAQAYRDHGPPPPNYRVERFRRSWQDPTTKKTVNQQTQKYTNMSVPGANFSFNHPLSPAGLQVNPNPIIENEFDDVRQTCRGFFQPPLVYKSNQWKWNYFSSWQGALTDALRYYKVSNNNKLIQEADIRQLHTLLKKNPKKHGPAQHHTLYHPADRDTMVFDGETDCALTLREINMKFSLVIVSPVVSKEGIDWNRSWDTHNRPPILARWSTGPQAQYQPLILGCLPMVTSMATKTKRDVLWFSLTPIAVNRKHPWFVEFSGKMDVVSIGQRVGFPMTRFKALGESVFLWAVVALHRRIVLGFTIPEDHLGCWLGQYGVHLAECAEWTNPHPSPFEYDRSKFDEYRRNNYIRVTFHMLTAWILNPSSFGNGTWIGVYARKWDEAIDTQIQYQLDKTDAKWSVFGAKMEAARKLPFA
ncbi:hypothetical protein P153DRAFT_400287 [Dothidotthia symphoricarpi CBS 119687]|uniref:Uncharacterized protein n=1 Tax=Dothidotthia symphoricarpi CBS 119687 TaxID=1392245 RepID=A0A6A6A1R8_9PLEO|nr:uncharacterized protein P153DRAFT_400287 [Dothidotthia symphoricarpi CBS 119687]KAF2125476.1 hypothetical protein P153DRAFT_400287 [Dothidotthia symphoricarpi CBS 119687]